MGVSLCSQRYEALRYNYYKKYLTIDKKFFRKGATKTLVADNSKAKKDFNRLRDLMGI